MAAQNTIWAVQNEKNPCLFLHAQWKCSNNTNINTERVRTDNSSQKNQLKTNHQTAQLHIRTTRILYGSSSFECENNGNDNMAKKMF